VLGAVSGSSIILHLEWQIFHVHNHLFRLHNLSWRKELVNVVAVGTLVSVVRSGSGASESHA